MSNTLLTPTAVTREALRVAHQKANFISNIDRQHDKDFAISGAKIGDSIKIRQPNEFTVTDGATLSAQDTTESSTTLQLTGRKHVGMGFTTADLSLSIDDFSERYITPAASVLIANVEADAITMYKSIYNQVNNIGSAATLAKVLGARKILNDRLAPSDMRKFCIDTQMNVDLVDGNKALFNDTKSLSKQYLDGEQGAAAGFSFYENTLMPRHTSGTALATAVYLTDCAAGEATGTAGLLHIDTGATTFTKGDIISIADVYEVHPETKASTGVLKMFVVTSNYAGGEGDLAISPSIVTSGAKQNVSAAVVDGKGITKHGGASAAYNVGLAFHKSAFTFATADLILPKGVHFGAREVLDGLSMRVVQSYDINNDKLPARLDIIYGYIAQRPEFAVRSANN
jgi:hypothetical protein